MNITTLEAMPLGCVVITIATPITANAITLGKATSFYPGTLDDVRLYNRALSPSEVKRLYHLGK